MNEVLYFVVKFIFNILSFLFVARFLLQACRVDFYNPIAQGIVKATDPLLKPLRILIPGFRNLDVVSVLAAVAAEMLFLFTLSSLAGIYVGTVLQIFTASLVAVALAIIQIVQWSIIIVIIASFVAPGNQHPALVLLTQITEPVLAPARRLVPPLGGLDFSPILVFLLLGVIQTALHQI